MRIDKLTTKSQEALQQAQLLAEKRNHQAIDVEHLLFALLGQKEGVVLSLLQKLGVAAGTLGTMRTAGMMVSMGIIMILFSLYIGQTEIKPETYPQFLESLRTGFIIFTIVSVLGLICQFVARSAAKARQLH